MGGRGSGFPWEEVPLPGAVGGRGCGPPDPGSSILEKGRCGRDALGREPARGHVWVWGLWLAGVE